MSENYIVINGKKAELTEEQLEKLGIKLEENKYKKMFERATYKPYYHMLSDGSVVITSDTSHKSDDNNFKMANYCANEDLMKQRALHETLNRLLWRASVIAGELDNEWNMNNAHYYIYHDFGSNFFGIDCRYTFQDQGACYFPTGDSACDALENIVKPFMKEHLDFVW